MADRPQDIINSGLTAEKVSRDRQNAFEIGFESYIEKAGFDDNNAQAFRAAASRGLQELNAQSQR
jgi:CheY-like chemotaxis protein